MKRILLRGLTLRICSTISRIVAEPEPLSLMPGPTPTLSRCAPTTMTLFGSPSRVSATTFEVSYVPGRQSTFRRAVSPVAPFSTPLASTDAELSFPATDGIEIPSTLIHVPPAASKKKIAPAPNCCAPKNFVPSEHDAPSCRSTIAPAGMPA